MDKLTPTGVLGEEGKKTMNSEQHFTKQAHRKNSGFTKLSC